MGRNKTNNIGIDGCIITASTSSSDPINIAAEVCRKRARIIMVGSTGMELRRDLFYKKEIIFRVSCSYGPGRYDLRYEKNSNDYPISYVRWTVQRNFQCILDSISRKLISPSKLISTNLKLMMLKKHTIAYKQRKLLGHYFKIFDNKNVNNTFVDLKDDF